MEVKPQSRKESLQLPAPRTIDSTRLEALKSVAIEPARYELKYYLERKEEEEDEYPLLCVLSDRKKDAHLSKLKKSQQNQPQTTRDRGPSPFQPTLVISKKLDTMQRLRERQKNSSDLVASLWR